MHEALKMVRFYRNVFVGNTGESVVKPLKSLSWLETFLWVFRYNDIIKVRKTLLLPWQAVGRAPVNMAGRQESAWRLYCLLNETCISIE